METICYAAPEEAEILHRMAEENEPLYRLASIAINLTDQLECAGTNRAKAHIFWCREDILDYLFTIGMEDDEYARAHDMVVGIINKKLTTEREVV